MGLIGSHGAIVPQVPQIGRRGPRRKRLKPGKPKPVQNKFICGRCYSIHLTERGQQDHMFHVHKTGEPFVVKKQEREPKSLRFFLAKPKRIPQHSRH